uniref:Secreted protein n=1 Tax=Arundo donax TaxID=35708 RepID=A0A0A9FIL2_ARUDO
MYGAKRAKVTRVVPFHMLRCLICCLVSASVTSCPDSQLVFIDLLIWIYESEVSLRVCR